MNIIINLFHVPSFLQRYISLINILLALLPKVVSPKDSFHHFYPSKTKTFWTCKSLPAQVEPRCTGWTLENPSISKSTCRFGHIPPVPRAPKKSRVSTLIFFSWLDEMVGFTYAIILQSCLSRHLPPLSALIDELIPRDFQVDWKVSLGSPRTPLWATCSTISLYHPQLEFTISVITCKKNWIFFVYNTCPSHACHFLFTMDPQSRFERHELGYFSVVL